MRLLHIIHTINPAGGGPIEGIRQLAISYKKMGVSVEVASLDKPGETFLSEFPVQVHALGPGYLGKYGYSKRLGPWLLKNHSNYDCIIVNGLWQYHSFCARETLSKTNTPYVVFTHGMLDPWFKHAYPLKHFKKWLYWPWGEYRVLRDAGAVLFTSEEEMLLASQSFWLYKAKSVVVGYGTNGPEVDLQSAKESFLNAHPELRGKRVAIFLGRIHPKKGCDLLIDAFAKKLASDPSWHLLMVGPDQVGWQSALVKRARHLGIEDRITWVGMAKGMHKWGAFLCAEIFVLPSHQENFGIVVAESLACGVPVLISNKINIWREVQSEGAGLVESDTLEGTEALLDRWIALSPEDQQTIRDRSVAAFRKHFDIHSNSQSVLTAIEVVLKAYRDGAKTPART